MYLPDDVLHIIYKYKHQLEYSDIMDELKKITIRCFFNINLKIANMVYQNQDKILVKCININNLHVTSKQILNTIKIIKWKLLIIF